MRDVIFKTTGAIGGAGTAYPLEHKSTSQGFSGVRIAQSYALLTLLCRSLFVPLIILFWPWNYLPFIDVRIVINPLVSSNFSFL